MEKIKDCIHFSDVLEALSYKASKKGNKLGADTIDNMDMLARNIQQKAQAEIDALVNTAFIIADGITETKSDPFDDEWDQENPDYLKD